MSLKVDGVTIQEGRDGENYTYVGVDESVRIDRPLNKGKIRHEYKSRVKKIWKSEFNDYSKVMAHNAFAAALVTPIKGILMWRKEGIREEDVTTRKIRTMTGSSHRAGDVDRLYADRNKGGRGFRITEDLYEIRIVGLMSHLERAEEQHSLLKLVKEHEKDTTIRLGEEFLQHRKAFQSTGDVNEGTRKEREERWKIKVTHGYLQKTLSADEAIDKQKTANWLKLHLTAHTEGHITRNKS